MNPDETKCANLGPRGIAKRRTTGILASVSAVIVAVMLVTSEWNPWWRLSLFPILYVAFVGFLQARSATCVYLAARGAREVDGGVEQVSDAEEVAALRRKGRRIMVQSIVIAGIITVALMTVR